ncbi:protein bicaudal D homolog 2-like isoform X2 [Ptychodera flava]|uniref:protein bicaudal D homolog 2-like isoform X2 n=1 Tax=Ptychodera flava TaxID=63121 RepID=UPI00396A63C1
MTHQDTNMESIEELKVEIDRLNRELSEASHEKIQAAEYGLVVLEEKQALKQQYEDLESLYESTKHELQLAKTALDQEQINLKKHTQYEVTHEETLLQETASREADFISRISDLENEIKQCRLSVDRTKSENERVASRNSELNDVTEKLEVQRKQIKDELREYKFRETRLLQDYSELEEENIQLQKQVSGLKSSQVEFEAMKHEIRRMNEETEYLNTQVEDLAKLKEIAEKQIEETLNALEHEREQKHALKKELDGKMLSELEALNEDLESSTDRLQLDREECSSPDHPILRRMEHEFRASLPNEGSPQPAPATVSDLLSELHTTEVERLEAQLNSLKNEKSELSRTLQESHKELRNTKDALSEQSKRVNQLSAVVDQKVFSEFDEDGGASEDEESEQYEDLLDKDREIAMLKKEINRYEKRFLAAVTRVQKQQAELQSYRTSSADELQNIPTKVYNDLQAEMNVLNDNNRKQNSTVKELERKLKETSEIMGESQGNLNCMRDELISISEDLAQLYHHICTVNGETPNKVMLEHFKNTRMSRREGFHTQIASKLRGIAPSRSNNASGMSRKERRNADRNSKDIDEAMLEAASTNGTGDAKVEQNGILNSEGPADASTCFTMLATMRDQVKYLKRAVEHTLESARQHRVDGGGSAENEDLQDQVVKLKALLSTKREQITTLRTVLKANKTTAEVALANLKSKYANEKAIVAETMMKLRNELKALKEDAATFASLRAMFATRCDDYVTQLDEMQRKLASAEEERKTLNSLLRMAIQQKLALTQRLEDYEISSERQSSRRSGTRRQKSSRN